MLLKQVFRDLEHLTRLNTKHRKGAFFILPQNFKVSKKGPFGIFLYGLFILINLEYTLYLVDSALHNEKIKDFLSLFDHKLFFFEFMNHHIEKKGLNELFIL
jgi:hypothetical protein